MGNIPIHGSLACASILHYLLCSTKVCQNYPYTVICQKKYAMTVGRLTLLQVTRFTRLSLSVSATVQVG